jgi:hypothetical protein
MTSSWPTPEYGEWSATCDTLHAHTQVTTSSLTRKIQNAIPDATMQA